MMNPFQHLHRLSSAIPFLALVAFLALSTAPIRAQEEGSESASSEGASPGAGSQGPVSEAEGGGDKFAAART